MDSFRIIRADIDSEELEFRNINFIHDKHKNNNENIISVLIGNNGAGKSRVLRFLTNYFVDLLKNKDTNNLFQFIQFTGFPNKVIAITNSISDKFPTDDTFKHLRYSKYNYKDLDYVYLGPRTRNFAFSSKALMNRAMDIIFENYTEELISENYRYIFDYLDYEPVIKLRFNITRRIFNKNNKNYIYPSDLENFISNNDSYYTIKNLMNDKEVFRLEEICNFLNDSEMNNRLSHEIIINFSERNIDRIKINDKEYKESYYTYKILTLLRKMKIATGYSITLYKKDGNFFSFDEASSGEANILSTMISLIPIIENNSLVMIDEPEISLHPMWQSKYIDLLRKILSHVSGCHIIIATHSHLLISDLHPEASSVVVLNSKKGKYTANLLDESTYGWSSEDILLNIFNMPSTRNYYLSQLITESLELLAENKSDSIIFKKNIKKLGEYFPLLKDVDPLKKVISGLFEAL